MPSAARRLTAGRPRGKLRDVARRNLSAWWVAFAVPLLLPAGGCGTPGPRLESVCGNGQLDPGEACDDGNRLPGDGCDPQCRLEPGADADAGGAEDGLGGGDGDGGGDDVDVPALDGDDICDADVPGEADAWPEGGPLECPDASADADPPTGTLEWVVVEGGHEYDQLGGLAVGPDGSVTTGGAFERTGLFGRGEPGETNATSVGSSDCFLAHHASDGSLRWVRTFGSTSEDRVHSIVTVPAGVLAGGALGGVAVLGTGEPAETTLGRVVDHPPPAMAPYPFLAGVFANPPSVVSVTAVAV